MGRAPASAEARGRRPRGAGALRGILAGGLLLILGDAGAAPPLLFSDHARLERVEPGGIAAEAGLRPGDLLVSLDGAPADLEAAARHDAVEWRTHPCRVGVSRGGQILAVQLPPGPRGWALAPDWTPQGRRAAAEARAGGDLPLLCARLSSGDASPACAWLLLSALAEGPGEGDAEALLAGLEGAGIPHPPAFWGVAGHLALGDERLRRQDAQGALAAYRDAVTAATASGEGDLIAWAARKAAGLARPLGYGDDAAAWLSQVVALLSREHPVSLELASALNEQGNLALDREDLPEALERLSLALGLAQAVEPDGPATAAVLSNLGQASWVAGDWGRAHDLLSRALALRQAQGAGPFERARLMNTLGVLASDLGDDEGAVAMLTQALPLMEEARPGSVELAGLLSNLGASFVVLGRLDEARVRLEEALALNRRLNPGSLDEGLALQNLGRLRLEEGDAAGAVSLLTEARAPIEAAAPGSTWLAMVDTHLGDALRRQGEAAAALDRYRAAAAVALARTRGGDVSFTRRAAHPTFRLVGALIDAGRPEEALAALDRFKARALADGPGWEGAEPGPDDGCATLPVGSVYLSWLTHPDGALAVGLVKDPGGCRALAARIPRGDEALAAQVDLLRAEVERPGGPSDRWRPMAEGLYALLIGPFEGALVGADRLIVSPDGPLEALPWAALVGRGGAPLVTRLAISTTPSLRVDALLGARPMGASGAPRWVGVGAPDAPDPALRLSPLEGARAELVDAAARFGGEGRLYLGPDATVARVLGVPSGTALLHIAAHGVLSGGRAGGTPRVGLALEAPPPGEGGDGLLTADAIVAAGRREIDLVVLSGCHTGQGPTVSGEGALSLGRAFVEAGARSAVVSLWAVGDEGTAALVGQLYDGLAEGLSRDEALSRAQRRILAEPGHSHPYYWAGLRLLGARGPIAGLTQARGVGWAGILPGGLALLAVVALGAAVGIGRGRAGADRGILDAPARR